MNNLNANEKSHTLIILKPDALERNLTEHILDRFKTSGFNIEIVGFKVANDALMFEHYKDVINKIGNVFKERILKSFVGKTMLPIIISHNFKNAIDFSREIIGSTDPSKAEKGTIRGDFGMDSIENAVNENRCCNNLIHGSDSISSFCFEVSLWFDNKVSNKYIIK